MICAYIGMKCLVSIDAGRYICHTWMLWGGWFQPHVLLDNQTPDDWLAPLTFLGMLVCHKCGPAHWPFFCARCFFCCGATGQCGNGTILLWLAALQCRQSVYAVAWEKVSCDRFVSTRPIQNRVNNLRFVSSSHYLLEGLWWILFRMSAWLLGSSYVDCCYKLCVGQQRRINNCSSQRGRGAGTHFHVRQYTLTQLSPVAAAIS